MYAIEIPIKTETILKNLKSTEYQTRNDIMMIIIKCCDLTLPQDDGFIFGKDHLHGICRGWGVK